MALGFAAPLPQCAPERRTAQPSDPKTRVSKIEHGSLEARAPSLGLLGQGNSRYYRGNFRYIRITWRGSRSWRPAASAALMRGGCSVFGTSARAWRGEVMRRCLRLSPFGEAPVRRAWHRGMAHRAAASAPLRPGAWQSKLARRAAVSASHMPGWLFYILD
jgi:hypothetical protein